MQNEMIGRKVIVRSNEYDSPLLIGTLTGYVGIGLPVVMSECGKELMCGGIVIPYTEEMHEFLLTLTGNRQWEILRGISVAIMAVKHGSRQARERKDEFPPAGPIVAPSGGCITCHRKFTNINPDFGGGICKSCWGPKEGR